MTTKPVRHVLGLSGGKDSTALAYLLHKEIPQMEYFFCDTGKELAETYEYLERIQARLGITVTYLNADRDFDYWLNIYNGFLPSPQMRWCTRQLKLVPLENFIGEDETLSYVAIRADENRDGYLSTKSNIKAIYPFKEKGIDKAGVLQLLDESGIGLPKYYEWRTRSGCFFCFFQRKYEWVMLAEKHPDLFAKAVAYEQEHKDGRQFTWSQGETLVQIVNRKKQIIAEHEKNLTREKKKSVNRPLSEALAAVLDEEDDTAPCLACHL